jgi:hypothetical protein
LILLRNMYTFKANKQLLQKHQVLI